MRHEKGFTLVELLVAMAVAGVVMAGIYSAYYSQQKSSITQSQVAAMQQNLRASMHLMEREIRLAGHDPTNDSGAGIVATNANSINFTLDIHDSADNDGDGITDEPDEEGNGDGDVNEANENITYQLLDPDGDGVFDLFRTDAVAGNQLLAENIDAVDFIYFDGRLFDGVDNDGDGTTDEDDEATPVANAADVRAVDITLVARTRRGDRGYTDTEVFSNQLGTVIWGPGGDNNRRRALSTRVTCRNLGL